MRHSTTNFVSIFILGVLIVVTKAQNCTTKEDSNATYNPKCPTTNPYDVGCVVTKTCNAGYNLTNVVATDLTCLNNGSWNPAEELCMECKNPNYGTDCSETSYCASDCQYDNKIGCASNPSTPPWANCHLNDVQITIPDDELYKTIGWDSTFSITLYTNISDNEVNVTVTFNDVNTTLNNTNNDTGTAPQYTFQIDVRRSSAGVYSFNAETAYGSDKKTVTVKIYDPVEIIGIYEKDSDVLIPEDGNIEITAGSTNISYTCNADGIDDPQTYWEYGSNKVTDSKMESRIYQIQNDTTSSSTLYIRPETGVQMKDSGRYTCYSTNIASNSNPKDSFEDIRTINLVVREPDYKATQQVNRQEFLIAVCLLGIFLFITIVLLVVLGLWVKKKQANFKNNTQPSDQPAGRRINKYEPDHTPSSQRTDNPGGFDDIQRPSSPSTSQPTTTPAIQRDTRPNTTTRPANTRHTKKLPLPQQERRDIPKLHGMQTHRPGDYQGFKGGGAHHNPAFQSPSNEYSDTLYEEGTYDEPANTEQPTYEEPLNTRETPVYDDRIP